MKSTHSRGTRSLAALTALSALALSGCGTAPEPVVDAQPAPMADGMIRTTINDPMIAGITRTANNGEIEQARLALERAENPAVRSFAQRMITDHTRANERLDAVTRDHGMVPRGAEVAAQLQRSTRETMAVLRGLEGERFDRTYIRGQIDMHRWLLETIDDTLLPSARNNELTALLRDIRPTIAAHLQEAQSIQSRF